MFAFPLLPFSVLSVNGLWQSREWEVECNMFSSQGLKCYVSITAIYNICFGYGGFHSFIKKKGVILPIFRIKSTKEKCSDTVDVPAMTLTECGCDN